MKNSKPPLTEQEKKDREMAGLLQDYGRKIVRELVKAGKREPSYLGFCDWEVFRRSFGWFQKKKALKIDENPKTEASFEEAVGIGFKEEATRKGFKQSDPR